MKFIVLDERIPLDTLDVASDYPCLVVKGPREGERIEARAVTLQQVMFNVELHIETKRTSCVKVAKVLAARWSKSMHARRELVSGLGETYLRGIALDHRAPLKIARNDPDPDARRAWLAEATVADTKIAPYEFPRTATAPEATPAYVYYHEPEPLPEPPAPPVPLLTLGAEGTCRGSVKITHANSEALLVTCDDGDTRRFFRDAKIVATLLDTNTRRVASWQVSIKLLGHTVEALAQEFAAQGWAVEVFA